MSEELADDAIFQSFKSFNSPPDHHFGVIPMVMDQSASRDQSLQPDWQIQVEQWRLQACQYSPDSRERKHYLTKIIRVIAPKLWRVNTPYYADALQKTWAYFIRKVCTTYDPSRALLTTWLNVYLRYRHQDLLKQAAEEQQKLIPLDPQVSDAEGTTSKVIKEVPSKDYGSLGLLEQVINWVETDTDGMLRQIHLTGRPDINCQTIILLRLPPETPWKEISTRFNEKVPTLAAFYQRKCLPRLRKYGQSEGLLESH